MAFINIIAMKLRFTITAFFLFVTLFVSIAQEFNPNRLKEIYEEQNALYLKRADRINMYLENNPSAKSIFEDEQSKIVIHDVVNGKPTYIYTENEQARKTTGVEEVQSATGLNLPLLGENITIGVWDGGLVLNTHQEFQGGRIKNKQGTTYDTHATHVSGTIGAAGVVAEAKGMMPEVTIHSYYAFENDLGPMANEASDGLILSNHSYGYVLGWNYNSSTSSWAWYGDETETDSRFGAYTNDSRTIDEITYNAPNYTVVWAAGNDRSDVGDGTRPADGPYGIIGPKGISKNIITVGAITGFDKYESVDDAVMSSFSSWGPTKDGRVKPDLVGDGVGVYSTSSTGNDQYTTLQGTSMAAPNVTGSLGLIQQYNLENSGSFLTSAELKGLAIHTARDVGSALGPDYAFGWGVLNVGDAIKLLNKKNDYDSVLIYAELQNGDVDRYEFYSDGKSSIKATLVWTDPAGNVIDNTSTLPNLINDLDCRIYDEEGNVTLPWVLSKDEPFKPASRGDNVVDNVEQVLVSSPEARKYTIAISHKGLLSSQNYALIITGGGFAGDLSSSIYWSGESSTTFNTAINWSGTSGGVGDPQIVVDNSSVIFDNNGLSGDLNVSLDENTQLKSLLQLSDRNVVVDLAGYDLIINEQIITQNGSLSFRNGNVIIEPTQGIDINLNFDASDNCNVILRSNYSHELISSIDAMSLNLISGTYSATGYNFVVDSLKIGEDVDFKLADSEMTIRVLLQESNTVDFSNNNWTFVEGASINTSANWNDKIVIPSSARLSGQFKVQRVAVEGNLEVLGLLETDSLVVSGEVNIQGNDTIKVVSGLILDAGAQIKGADSDSRAVLSIGTRKKRCYSDLTLENILLVNDGVFNVGLESSVLNCINVLELNCSELLFPDFELENFCANSVIKINDESDGEIDTYSWDFGNGLDFTSDSSAPLTWYHDAGEYNVTLTIANENQVESYNQSISIVANNLEEFSLIETDQGLVASLLKESYSWFEDGELIEGETGRILSGMKNGKTYNAAYYESSSECKNRISDGVVFVLGDNEPDLTIYPVPSKDNLYLNGIQSNDRLIVYDINGLVNIDLTVQKNISQLDISRLNNGVYILNIIRKGNIVTSKRFIKE